MVSIIIPTYNRAAALENCLNSLKSQSFQNFEVIVVDDASKDNTKEVCDRFANFFDLNYFLMAKCSGGPAKPRNLGVKNAKFEWVAFLDSDDTWENNKLQEVMKVLNNDDVDLVFHNFYFPTINNLEAKNIDLNNNVLKKMLFLKGNFIVNSSVVVKKNILLYLGAFDESDRLISAEDYDLWIRISLITNKYRHINKQLGIYSYSDDSISNDFIRKMRNINYLIYKHRKIFFKNPFYLISMVRSYFQYLIQYFRRL